MTAQELSEITGRWVQTFLIHPPGDDTEMGYETVGYPVMIRDSRTLIRETEENILSYHLDQCPPFGLLDVGTFTTGEYLEAFGKDPMEAPIVFMGVQITYEDRERISRDGS